MEDNRMQIKAEASQLCKMLSKPHNERMPFEGVEISKTLQRVSLLPKFFDMKSEAFINLCISSNVYEFYEGESLYKYESINGERYLYVILEGTVQISLLPENVSLQQENVDSIHKLWQFGLFGQTEIFFEIQGRNQKIIAPANTGNLAQQNESEKPVVKCMLMPEEQVAKIINKPAISMLSKAYNYLTVNDYFEKLRCFEKRELVLFLTLKSFRKEQVIISSHSNAGNCKVLFMIHGSVSVLKQLLRHVGEPNSKKTQKSQHNCAFKIDTLEQMSSFGQYQCARQEPYAYELIANGVGAYYELNYQELKPTNHRVLQIISENAIPYPSDEELGFLYEVKGSLEMIQDRVVRRNKIFC